MTKRAKFVFIFFTAFVHLIGFGIVLPVLPLYAKRVVIALFEMSDPFWGQGISHESGLIHFGFDVQQQLSQVFSPRLLILVGDELQFT